MGLKNKLFRHRNTAILLVGSSLIFLFGWSIGSGRLDIGNDSIFKKSVNKNLPNNLDYSSVEELYDQLRSSFDGKLEKEKLLDGLKQGLASASGDSYTEYLNVEEAKDFKSDLNGSFVGIGAELAKDPDSKQIVIVSPISGFPAEKAGLRPRDVILGIDDKSAYDMTTSEAVKNIRGAENTKVKLKILRDNQQELTFEIARAIITIPSVESSVTEDGVGYIKVSRFSEDTAELSRKAAESFRQSKVKGVILDVRSNPGGLLEAAVDVASLWLNNKTVLQEKRDNTIIRTYTSRGDALLEGVPTVVLADDGSASASEIVAGALRDNKAATLLGIKTFGKGSVQSLENLSSGGILKVTIARWYTPNGKNIDKEGIAPDKVIDRSDEDYRNGLDPQKDEALKLLN